LIPAGAIGIFH